MATLNEYLGGLFGSISEARVMADVQSAQVAEQYAKHDLLKHFSIPRLRIGDIELTIPVAIQGLSERTDWQLDPIGNAEFKRATIRELTRYVGYLQLPPLAEQRASSAFDARIPELVREIRDTGDVQKSLYNLAYWAVEQFQRIVKDTGMRGDGIERIYAVDEAVRHFHDFGLGLVKGVVEKPQIDQLTVVAESEQLRNQRPEDIIRIRMRVSEDGMEWQTLQRDDGTIERKLVSE
jgi:hypothetical protein